jgi:DivIVA domain-containing protein
VDREDIERQDFPTGRRGYDPAAVHEHLRRVADELDALRHRPPAPAPASVSGDASEQVRRILEAAEQSAAQMRAQAGQDATDHVARVRTAAEGLLGRLDDLEHELGGLLAALRTTGTRLITGLAELEAEVDTRGDVGPPAAADPLAAAGDAPPPRDGSPQPADAAEEDFAAAGPAEADPLTDRADEAGARLIALNMALGGSSREETARYLADHFMLPDAAALLEDVYAKVGR